jgi:hypothetical protein
VEVPGPLVLKDPQALAVVLAQVTVHLIPAPVVSLLRVTANVAVAFTCNDAGAAELNATEIGDAGVGVALEEPPQPANAAPMLTAAISKIHRRTGIVASVLSIRLRFYCLRPVLQRSNGHP